MHHSARSECAHGGDAADPLAALRQAIEHASHYLPSQGPIRVFVHHNTLHSLEHLPFDEAVRRSVDLFGSQPFWSEERYQQELAKGRIRQEDIAAVLLEDLGEQASALIGFLGTRYHFRLAMLSCPLQLANSAELRWLVAETDALRRFRPDVSEDLRRRMLADTRHWAMRDLRNGSSPPASADARHAREALTGLIENAGSAEMEHWTESQWEAFHLTALWRICHRGVHGVERFSERSHPPLRHRDLLLEVTGQDIDQPVNELLIRFCSSFLDQGLASWTLPQREAGFFRSFLETYRQPLGPPDRWLGGISFELKRLAAGGADPLASIGESLHELGVSQREQEDFLRETLLALPGWAGMVWQMETNAEWTLHPAPRGSLLGYLAVRLLLERAALADAAKRALGFTEPLSHLRNELHGRIARQDAVSVDQRAFVVFQLAQVLGWRPADLIHLTKSEWTTLVREIVAFSSFERRRILHGAFERRYSHRTLDAIAAHTKRLRAGGRVPTDVGVHPTKTPKFQWICCIDEREESFRRHLEEIEPEVETFGAAGFFAVAMYYRGVADAHYIPLCPVVVKPKHWVQEEVLYSLEGSHRRRAKARQVLGRGVHRVHVGSQTFVGGLLTALFGPLASVPLVARVLFPRLTARVRRLLGSFVQPPPATQLILERSEAEPGQAIGHIGYSVTEMAGIVERLLRDIGLTRNLAPLIIIAGHGSSSLNNPHESAYNCGACSGGRGGPNARAYAQMANDPRVRELLAGRGLVLPKQVHFVGAFHNTCDDSVTYFDLDRIPVPLRPRFEEARAAVQKTRERNAHERCRRFESAPLMLTPEAALRHVEARSEDLSQARPEYNHATNALCFVGQRWFTRGLFLDRRAFMHSYNPADDDEQNSILTRILLPVIPVCGGISLEYYFSCVDPAVHGCGSKLPHNIVSLLGVMEGAASDLRPGLSQQMIEIHEPVRLLFVVQTTPEAMLRIIERNRDIAQLCRNRWVQLATFDPFTGEIHKYLGDRFERYEPESDELEEVPSSAQWYRGWREHLGFCRVVGKGDGSDGNHANYESHSSHDSHAIPSATGATRP